MTEFVCPERIAVWLPVSASRIVILQSMGPVVAILLFQHARLDVAIAGKIVQMHVPHWVGPATALILGENSEE